MSTVGLVPTALLSVYDKTGVADLARSLADLGWSLVSSGGTAKAIAEAGVEVTDVVEWTGVPAILGHRVVTLHPKVHGGILADPTNAEHRADMEAYGITPIELVVANLYPFGSDPSIEMIDIGGPAMVRAAAKNHAYVGVVVDPADYDGVVTELTADGALGDADPSSACPGRLRAHRRVRRRDRHVVRRVRRPDRRPTTTSCPSRSICPSRRHSTSATARTRTRRALATAKSGPPAGGTR